MTTLRRIFDAEGIKSVKDSQAKWLRVHRPSVAFLICIGSGPWRYPRRLLIQTQALSILGKRDITELEPHEISEMFPLDWQRQITKAAIAFCKSKVHGYSLKHARFDTCMDVPDKPTREQQTGVHGNLHSIYALSHGYHSGARGGAFNKPLPKVLGMYVRDFLMLDSFPQDRHVRKWLKDHKLPTNHGKIMEMFEAEKLHARYYARALFLDKSKNPTHKPTRPI